MSRDDAVDRPVNPKRVRIKDPNTGKNINLASLPLVAYALNCNHLGKDYGVKKRDFLFCDKCGTTKQVARILSQ